MLPEPALKAIAHPTRRRMLELVWDRERSSTDLAEETGLTRPATSQHLKVLREAELVFVRPEGNLRLYRANLKNLADLRAFLNGFWGARLEALRDSVEEQP
jgi:DNA-binding transcriptional ArsR family regulator